MLQAKTEYLDSSLQLTRIRSSSIQLAVYSIDCIYKVVTPPYVGWQYNIREAIKCGAPELLVSVLKLHPKDAAVLLAVSRALQSLSVDSTVAEIIVNEGGVVALLSAIDDSTSEGRAF